VRKTRVHYSKTGLHSVGTAARKALTGEDQASDGVVAR
jgi:hypothetical protein